MNGSASLSCGWQQHTREQLSSAQLIHGPTVALAHVASTWLLTDLAKQPEEQKMCPLSLFL